MLHWQVFRAKEPTQLERIELILADLLATYINAHGKKKVKTTDLIRKVNWKTEKQQDVDTIKKAFGLKK